MITEAAPYYYNNIFFHTEGDEADPNFLALKAAFARLEASELGSFLWTLESTTSRPIYITSDASIAQLVGRGSLTTMIGADAANKPDYVETGHFVFMSPTDAGGNHVNGFQSDFDASFDRLLFHELFHVYENLNELNSAGDITADDWTAVQGRIDFSEEIAVFAENFIYAGAAGQTAGDGDLRLGHASAPTDPLTDDPFSEGGASGMSGFAGFPMIRTFSDEGDRFTFAAHDTDGHINRKTYYKPDFDLFGNGSPLTTYDHYIRYEAEGGFIAFNDPQAVTKPSNLTAMLPDVMFDNADAAFGTVANVFGTVNHLFDGFWSQNSSGAWEVRTYASELRVAAYGIPATYNDMFVTRFVGIGADRWGDGLKSGPEYVDLSGPVQSGSEYPTSGAFTGPGVTISAPRLAIDDHASTIGTVLAGGSGFTLANAVLPGTYVDATASSDWLIAGTGDDIVIMGSGGRDPANANYGYGNAGNDVLIGRDGIDNLFGGDGDDIFSPGRGADYIVGGTGLDTLDYHESATGVWLDLGTRTGLLGDADGDSWRGIEKFIGSNHDDTFIGAGNMFMAGMEGNDTFHLKNGDVAFGGAGADVFYIDITPGSPASVGIIDLDPSDRIYINGSLFQGYGTYANGTSYMANMTGQVVYDGNTPGYPMLPETMAKISFAAFQGFNMYGPPPGPSTPVLDIYVAGYTSGDGGLYMNPTNAPTPFPFHPAEVVI